MGCTIIAGLSRQKFCRDRIMFVATKYFCHDRTICRDKYILSRQGFVATSILLSRQVRVCLDKTRLCPTNISRDKSFVVTNIILSQKRRVLSRQTPVCRDHFLFVSLPANDTVQPLLVGQRVCRHPADLLRR